MSFSAKVAAKRRKTCRTRQHGEVSGRVGRAQQAGSQRRRLGVLLPAMASAVCLWAAFPPLGWSGLAWLAPLGWLALIERREPLGGKGYGVLWLAGCLFWLAILHGIRLAYWPLVFGWLALSLYLAVYLPLFVGIARLMRWKYRIPLVLAAPTVWLGSEQIRSYLLTGYAANSLGHSQAHNPLVIQVADQVGVGGVGFVMMSVAAAISSWLHRDKSSDSDRFGVPHWISLSWSGVLLAMTLGYGWWRLEQADRLASERQPLLRVLLVQENTPSIFDDYSPERNQAAWESYLAQTRLAAVESGRLDLVVWPESTFTANEPWLEANLTGDLPEELKRAQVDDARLRQAVEDMQAEFHRKAQLVQMAASAGTPVQETIPGDEPSSAGVGLPFLLVGCDTWIYRSQAVERYNAAIFVGRNGQPLDRYFKTHLVMFGEYIPLGGLLAWLGDLVNLAGMNAGQDAACFQVGATKFSPSICFESMLPWLISGQVRELKAAGSPPDVLINITNDSWFRGSSMLDHHLSCSMMCAVENRRPLLVAANTGISAQIDGSGRLLQSSQRLTPQGLLAQPQADGRWGLVQSVGYPLAWLCAGLTVLAAIGGLWGRRAQDACCLSGGSKSPSGEPQSGQSGSSLPGNI